MWAISPEPLSKLAKYANKNGITYPMLSDGDLEATRRYGILNPSSGGEVPHPTTLIVDAEGRIRWVRMDEDFTLRPTVDAVLRRLDIVISAD